MQVEKAPDIQAASAVTATRRRGGIAASGSGGMSGGTILTGPSGIAASTLTTGKTLLGA